MRRLINRTITFFQSDWSAPLALLAVSVAAYALWLPHLGFYWDSWPMNWIAQTMGADGLARYFSTNRPVWGVFYQLSTPLLGAAPLPWQVSALVLRWLTGVAAWALVRLLWPRQKAAVWVSLLFVVYPGFQQQSIGLLYTHFFIVLNAFLWSLVATLAALRRPKWFWPFSAAALLLSLVNLFSMEYFFMLELLRPLLIWLVLGDSTPERRKRWLPALCHWLPYLAVFMGAGVWRALLFPYTENNYRLVVVEQLQAQPMQTLIRLALKALEQFWIVIGQAWGRVFNLPLGADATLARRYWPVVALCLAGLTVWLAAQKPGAEVEKRGKPGWTMMAVGGVALLLAGWPFWLTDVPFSLQFAFDRFTLPFMLGVSLLLGGLAWLLPVGRWLRAALLAGLVALAVGMQIGAGYSFVQDWTAQKSLFWQLAWRVPSLRAGTLVIANETRSTGYSTDNSLSAPFNWIYAPTLNESPPANSMPYMLVYPSIRLGNASLPALEKGQTSYKDYLVAEYRGSTDQALAIYYEPPGCLRVLEPVDGNDPALPDAMRKAALLSQAALILPNPAKPAQPMRQIFGAEPAHGWCYYFQKASLARQQGNWLRIAELGQEAEKLGWKPVLPAELLPFIEAQARLGNWPRAQQVSLQAAAQKPDPGAALCTLWQNLLTATPESEQRSAAWDEVQVKLACGK